MKSTSTSFGFKLCMLNWRDKKASIKSHLLLISLSILISISSHAQQDAFHVVQGAEMTIKKQTIDPWSTDGYLFELKNNSMLEVYKKAVFSFGRLNEFRRADENNRIPINENDGYLVVLSWKDLGIEGGKEGQFARRKLKFVMNDNAQLKEQFLD